MGMIKDIAKCMAVLVLLAAVLLPLAYYGAGLLVSDIATSVT
jgi:hypothetical protein